MASYTITGEIEKIFEVETKGESFHVRNFVIKSDDSGQYDNFVQFQMTQDRVGFLDSFKEGERVKVHFDLRGRQWQEKYFTNLNAWRVDREGAEAEKAAPAPAPVTTDEPTAEASDDLPF